MIITGNSSRNGGDAKCSICQTRFSTAQEFYEHLDDCVLNVIVPTTPKALKDRVSTPQKGDDRSIIVAMEDSDEKGKSEGKGSTDVSPGKVIEPTRGDKMDVDSDRD
ncbi:hypothetical protein PC116_g34210 [Phytophthora cactorum]|nr:hypothetical protein PC116_g34210 [Phytophthora cactorum]